MASCKVYCHPYCLCCSSSFYRSFLDVSHFIKPEDTSDSSATSVSKTRRYSSQIASGTLFDDPIVSLLEFGNFIDMTKRVSQLHISCHPRFFGRHLVEWTHCSHPHHRREPWISSDRFGTESSKSQQLLPFIHGYHLIDRCCGELLANRCSAPLLLPLLCTGLHAPQNLQYPVSHAKHQLG